MKRRFYHRLDFWFSVGMLLIGFIIRAHAIEALPPFNDESLHIRRAEKILVERNVSLTPFKLLTYYWIALFQPDRLVAIFVSRTAVGLFALLGLAGTYATARLVFGRWAGRIALVLAAFSPFMVFFDRLALADPLTAALGMLVVWMSVRMVRREDCGRWCPEALMVGMLGALVVLAKTIGLPFLAMPAIAVLALGRGAWPANRDWRTLRDWTVQRLRRYQGALVTAYGAFVACMVPFGLHVLERAIAGEPVMLVNNNLVLGLAENRPPHEVIFDNIATLWNVNWILHSPFLWLTMLLAAGLLFWRCPAKAAYLTSAVVLPWTMSILLGAELSTRYLTLGILPLMVLLAGGLQVVGQQAIEIWGKQHSLRPLMVGIVVLWVGLFAVPFIENAWNEPTDLELPSRDQWEYFENFSSGYGLVAAADDLDELPSSEPSGRVNVFGMIGSCHQVRLYLGAAEADDDGPVWLTCPFFGWHGEYLMDVAADIQRRMAIESQVYLLLEPEIPYFDTDKLKPLWQWQEIKRYRRPFDGMEIVLYRITPIENAAESSDNRAPSSESEYKPAESYGDDIYN
ncbi:MAG: glycosyltransferase family 39 protein [Chloroflexi bacterium]|nr:glycosyltransferase family 39 protein [Chloroflexota bacterium]